MAAIGAFQVKGQPSLGARQFHVSPEGNLRELVGIPGLHGRQQRAVRRRINFADAVMGQTLGIITDKVGIQGFVAIVDLAWSWNLAFGNRRPQPNSKASRSAR